ncbi:hypothetical protein GGS24DRAFT_499276 [Hypoxylon argillaceum]|nr:hypothetical protein GGS24DRAFT_499276 [Hypoxylon argillaceum]
MAPVTEVVLLTLAPGADYAAITASAKTIAQQPGCLAVRTSRLHGEPHLVHYFIDWDAVESHHAFERNGAVYGPFLARLGAAMTGYAAPYHVALEPFPPAVFDGRAEGDGAVVVVGKAWFPGGAAGREEAAAAAFAALVDGLRGAPGFTGEVARGWSLESEVVREGGGGRSRVFLFAVGWESVEAGVRFREEGEFGEAVARMEGVGGLEVCLVNLQGVSSWQPSLTG